MVFATVIFLGAEPANAGLQICNKTDRTVQVVVAQAWSDAANVLGWFAIAPGGCQTALDQPLDTTGGIHYYYHARDDASHTWSGDRFYCVASVGEQFGYLDKNFSAAEMAACAPPLFKARGERRGFKPVETQGAANFTLNLVANPSWR